MKIFWLLTFLLLGSCAYDNREDLLPTDPGAPDSCGLTDVSFAAEVQPLLVASCNQTCHNAVDRRGGVVLETHAEVESFVRAERLLGTVRRAAGFSAMPPGSRLPECDLEILERWVAEGALNN